LSVSGRVAKALFNHPWLALLTVLGIIAGSVSAAMDLRIEFGLDQLLPGDSDVKIVADEVAEHFVNDNVAFIVYEGGDSFSFERLTATRALVEALEQLSLPPAEEDGDPIYLVEQAVAITNVDDLVGADGRLRTVPLVPDPIPTDTATLAAIRLRAEANPIIHQQLLSPRDDAGLIVVRLPFELDADQQGSAIVAIQALLAETRAADPAVTFYLTGEPVFRRELAKFVAAANQTLLPLQYLIVLVLLIVFLRAWLGVLVVLVTVTLNVVVSIGVLAATGGSLNSTTAVLPTVMLALSVAMTLHFYSELGKRVATTGAPDGRRADVAEENLAALLPPVLMATLTTAAGFASLLSGAIVTTDELAKAGAGGMIAALVLTVLMYAIAARWAKPESLVSPRGVARSPVFGDVLDRLAGFVVARHRPLLAGFTLITIGLLVAVPRVRLDMEWRAFFREHVQVRQDTEYAQEHLGGTWQVVVSLRTEDAGRFTRPEELAKIRELEAFLREEVGVKRVISVADFLGVMNREMEGRPADDLRVPETAQQGAQLLLLNSNTTIEQYVDAPHQWARIEARRFIAGTNEAAEHYAKIDAYLAEHFPESEGYVARATGRSRTNTEIGNYLLTDQASSLLVACGIVLLCMFGLFRSVSTGLFCMIPNLLPVVVVFGLMGWFDVPLDTATILTSSIAVGIAVDDTVHFVDYLRARLIAGADTVTAIHETFRMKGPAMVWTTVVLTVGFSVLALGDLAGTAAFGLLLAAGMIAALIGDLVLLPATVLLVNSRLGVPAPKET